MLLEPQTCYRQIIHNHKRITIKKTNQKHQNQKKQNQKNQSHATLYILAVPLQESLRIGFFGCFGFFGFGFFGFVSFGFLCFPARLLLLSFIRVCGAVRGLGFRDSPPWKSRASMTSSRRRTWRSPKTQR